MDSMLEAKVLLNYPVPVFKYSGNRGSTKTSNVLEGLEVDKC